MLSGKIYLGKRQHNMYIQGARARESSALTQSTQVDVWLYIKRTLAYRQAETEWGPTPDRQCDPLSGEVIMRERYPNVHHPRDYCRFVTLSCTYRN